MFVSNYSPGVRDNTYSRIHQRDLKKFWVVWDYVGGGRAFMRMLLLLPYRLKGRAVRLEIEAGVAE